MIYLDNVSKVFGEFSLKEISLEINPGEYFVILGPSGAGKTLILEMIAGLLQPDSGSVKGMDNRKTGFIYQDYMLFPHLNVFDNIAYGLKIKKQKKAFIDTDVSRLARSLHIDHLLSRNVLTLSGGEKQRVAIARAMAVQPDIYLFDEPTAALDRNARLRTQQQFVELHRKSKRVFIHVTHDFEEALALADRIAVINEGRIVQCGTPEEIFNHPKNKEIADFLGYRNVFSGKISAFNMDIDGGDGISITVPTESAESAYVAVKSDDIIVSKAPFSSSARNSFQGEVLQIIQKSSGVELVVDIGIRLHVDITRKSLEEMNIQRNDRLWATFKVSSLKIFEH